MAASGNDNAGGTPNNDTLVGDVVSDTISTGLGNDQVDGGTGTDLLVVDYGACQFYAGKGKVCGAWGVI